MKKQFFFSFCRDVMLNSHNDINNNSNNINTGGTNEFITFYLQFLATGGKRYKS